MDFNDVRCLKVIRASAGSGKTTALVRHYLELIFRESGDGRRFRHILAVTFTNKAAGEMKDRILEILSILAFQKPSSWSGAVRETAGRLIESLGISERELRDRAARNLRSLLHRYSDFRVETIDSFFHSVIRSFSFDLGLSRNFLIEMDQDVLLTLSVDDVLNACGRDPEVTALLESFVAYRLEEETGLDVGRALKSVSRAVVEDAETRRQLHRLKDISLTEWMHRIDRLIHWIRQTEERVHSLAQQGVDVMERLGLSVDDLLQKSRGVGAYLFNLRFDIKSDGWQPNSNVKEAMAGKWFPGGSIKNSPKNVERLNTELLPVLLRLGTLWEKEGAKWLLAKSAARTVHTVALFSEIRKRMENILTKRQSIHVSDLAYHVHRIVREEPIPFIYERVGTRFYHYLIDEFQDTSTVQFQNFLPLLEQSISTGNQNVVVGDAKQSIYRWRGADWEQFDRLPNLKVFPDVPWSSDWAAAIQRAYDEERLGGNYRSASTIVQFNNELYRFLHAKEETALSLYRDAEQTAKDDREGFVRIRWDYDKNDPLTLRGADVVNVIRQCREDGYRLQDIALLFRKNRQAEQWAHYLMAQGFAVVSPDSLLLDRQPEVLLMVSILEWQQRPSDRLCRGQMMMLLREVRPDLSLNAAAAKAAVRSWKDLRAWFDTHGIRMPSQYGHSLYEHVLKIIEATGLDPNGAVLSAFLDVVLDFSAHFGNSAADFIEWWNTRSNALPILMPSGLDALRMMTIHKAKGLEFPVVIVPECDWPPFETNRRPVWFESTDPPLDALSPLYVESKASEAVQTEEKRKGQVDMVNLLYVATTRCEDRLYLYANFGRDDKSKKQSVGRTLQKFLIEKKGWDGTAAEWTIGRPAPRRREHVSTVSPERKLDFVSTSDFNDRLRIRSSPDPFFDDSLAYGEVLHRLLARVNTADDLPDAAAEAAALGLDRTQIAKLLGEIERLVHHEHTALFFSPGFRAANEYEIIMTNGRIGRIDKLIDQGDSWTIVEYKTGQPSPVHESQVRDYVNALKKISDRPVHGFLIYTDSLDCREVP